MSLCGLPEFLAYCLDNPGQSLFELACQGSELMIGLAKLFCRDCGNGTWNMCKLLAVFLDLSGTSMVANDQINVREILQKLKREKLLIWDSVQTPQDEKRIEDKMPPLMRYIVKLLDDFDVGDTIPAFVKQILNALTLDINALAVDKLQRIVQNSTVYKSKPSDAIDIMSEEYDQIVSQMYHLEHRYLARQSTKTCLKYQDLILNERL